MADYKIKIPAQTFSFSIETGGVVVPPPVDPPPVDPGPINPPPVDPPPGPPNPPPVSTGFKVGTCSFPWFPQTKLTGIGIYWQRVYVSSGWIWQPEGIAVQPMHQAETPENHGLDEMLLESHAMGLNTLLTIHQAPEWFLPTGRNDGANDFAPVKIGADRSKVESYRDYAAFLFQIAARYGSVVHPDSVLRVDHSGRWSGDILNEKKSGLGKAKPGLLAAIEPWNECDKWWAKGGPGAKAYFEPEETAALMSACYDGHEGTLGAGVGIKTADPSMVVVMPGLTDFDFAYIQRMDDWFKANRKDRKWACSVFNVHHYSNIGNRYKQHPAQWVASGACLPHQDQNFIAIHEIVKFGKDRGMETFITEFGADRNAPSGMHSKGVGKSDAAFQAEIIIESIKAYKAAGVDAVFVFNACDENSGKDGGQFESSGIFTSQEDGYRPTPASEAIKSYLASQPKSMNLAVAPMKMSDGKRPMNVIVPKG